MKTKGVLLKSILCLGLTGMLLAGSAMKAKAGDIAIDENNFHDEQFRRYVSENIDTNGDGVLSDVEKLAVTEIDVIRDYNRDAIRDLTGIQNFKNLEKLIIKNHMLDTISLKENTKLKYLDLTKSHARYNDFNEEIQYLKDLETLIVQDTWGFGDREIVFPKDSKLTHLDLRNCSTNGINIDGCKFLTYLDLSFSDIGKLRTEHLSKLETLYLSETKKLKSLDLTYNTELVNFTCNGGTMKYVDISKTKCLQPGSTFRVGDSLNDATLKVFMRPEQKRDYYSGGYDQLPENVRVEVPKKCTVTFELNGGTVNGKTTYTVQTDNDGMITNFPEIIAPDNLSILYLRDDYLWRTIDESTSYIDDTTVNLYYTVETITINARDLIAGEYYWNFWKRFTYGKNANLYQYNAGLYENGEEWDGNRAIICGLNYTVELTLFTSDRHISLDKIPLVTVNGQKIKASDMGFRQHTRTHEECSDWDHSYESYNSEILIYFDMTAIIGDRVAQKNPTCLNYGVKSFYSAVDEKYYEDAQGKYEIKDLDAWKAGAGRIDKKPHSGGTATCMVKAKCSYCNQEYGSLTAHKYASTWSKDASNHWKVCSVCSVKGSVAAHVDTDKNEKCDTCSYNMHKHVGTLVPQVNATCTKTGVKAYYKCSCGKYYLDAACTKAIADLAAWKAGDGKIAMKAHTYGTAWSSDGTNHWHACSVCGAKKDSAAHTLKTTITTKATIFVDGKKETKCTVCSKVTKTDTIKAIKTIQLAETNYVYNGKSKKPAVTVKDSAGNEIAKTSYTVSYTSGRKNVGKYGVKVTFKGDYSGTKNLTFTINPPKTSISKVTAGKEAFTVKWVKKTTQVTGYEIQYSTSSTFKSGNKTAKVTSAKTASKTIKNLKAKKKYYVRIRTYKTVNKVKYYSDWSEKKSVTTKK